MSTELGNYNALMGALRRFFVPFGEDDDLDSLKHSNPQGKVVEPFSTFTASLVNATLATTPQKVQTGKHYSVRLITAPTGGAVYVSWRDATGGSGTLLTAGDTIEIKRGAELVWITGCTVDGSYTLLFQHDRLAKFVPSPLGNAYAPTIIAPKATTYYPPRRARLELYAVSKAYNVDHTLEYIDCSALETVHITFYNTTDKARTVNLWSNTSLRSVNIYTRAISAGALICLTLPIANPTSGIVLPRSLGVSSTKDGTAGSGYVDIVVEG